MFWFFVAKIDPSSESMQILGIVIPFHYFIEQLPLIIDTSQLRNQHKVPTRHSPD